MNLQRASIPVLSAADKQAMLASGELSPVAASSRVRELRLLRAGGRAVRTEVRVAGARADRTRRPVRGPQLQRPGASCPCTTLPATTRKRRSAPIRRPISTGAGGARADGSHSRSRWPIRSRSRPRCCTRATGSWRSACPAPCRWTAGARRCSARRARSTTFSVLALVCTIAVVVTAMIAARRRRSAFTDSTCSSDSSRCVDVCSGRALRARRTAALSQHDRPVGVRVRDRRRRSRRQGRPGQIVHAGDHVLESDGPSDSFRASTP